MHVVEHEGEKPCLLSKCLLASLFVTCLAELSLRRLGARKMKRQMQGENRSMELHFPLFKFPLLCFAKIKNVSCTSLHKFAGGTVRVKWNRKADLSPHCFEGTFKTEIQLCKKHAPGFVSCFFSPVNPPPSAFQHFVSGFTWLNVEMSFGLSSPLRGCKKVTSHLKKPPTPPANQNTTFKSKYPL